MSAVWLGVQYGYESSLAILSAVEEILVCLHEVAFRFSKVVMGAQNRTHSAGGSPSSPRARRAP
jgi:hypothetical protein